MNVDLGERFQYSLQFTDRDGHLALSPKQQRDFVRWARPDEIFSEPKMVIGQHVDCFSIKQTVRYITKDNFPNFMFVSLDMNIVDIMIF